MAMKPPYQGPVLLEQVAAGRRFPEDCQPAELLDAAFTYTVEQQRHADEWTADGPMWNGCAVRRAFIRGAVWQQREKPE